ncbi:acyl-CoA dehydrogenase family protein [Peribacillus frigoritolerans]|uniref:acyl-CoA dehydrogenase family protein n=1 Tax=Peribacillus frigoritolerans TaxID=450367 RepID=UPI0020BDFF7E|nr:acyl-CoA dehydrogenase family protein [Peribacillus frigoritolerans]
MFYGYSEEEKMLQRSVRDMFQERCTIEHVRSFMNEQKISNKLQKLLSSQGFLGIIEPNQSGQTVEGLSYASLISQEAGRALLPFPLLETMTGLYGLKTCNKHSQLVSDVEEGKRLLTVAWNSGDVTARKQGAEFILNGTLSAVPFAEEADVILANVRILGMGSTATDEETVIVIDAKHPSITSYDLGSMDETYPIYDVVINQYSFSQDAIVKGLGMGIGHQLMKSMTKVGTLLNTSELVGCSEQAMNITVDYTKERKQFDSAIAKFQAMKHMAAEMCLMVESSRVSVDYATWAIENAPEELDISISVAKSYTSNAAKKIAADVIQMHGGIGVTWEADIHLFNKRALRSASIFGGVYGHREQIAKVTLDK